MAERMHDAVTFTNKGETSGFTIIWVDITRQSPYFVRPKSNSPQEVAVCQSCTGRQDQQGTLMQAAKVAAGTLLSFLRRSASKSAGKASSHPSGPHGLASRGLFSLADDRCRRGPRYPVILGQCNGVRSRRLLIGGRGCIEMRFLAGGLRISAEPSFPASVYVYVCVWVVVVGCCSPTVDDHEQVTIGSNLE